MLTSIFGIWASEPPRAWRTTEKAGPDRVKHEYFREFQNRLRKRDIRPELQDYKRIQNKLCYTRIRKLEKVISPDFTFDEIKCAVQELKGGQCNDPTGLIYEVFKNSGDGLLLSILARLIPLKAQKWSLKIGVNFGSKHSKKKKGSFTSLKIYRGIFIVPIISIIFENFSKTRLLLY